MKALLGEVSHNRRGAPMVRRNHPARQLGRGLRGTGAGSLDSLLRHDHLLGCLPSHHVPPGPIRRPTVPPADGTGWLVSHQRSRRFLCAITFGGIESSRPQVDPSYSVATVKRRWAHNAADELARSPAIVDGLLDQTGTKYLPELGPYEKMAVVARVLTPMKNPADHLCVAGELFPARPCSQSWAIRGRMFEVCRG